MFLYFFWTILTRYIIPFSSLIVAFAVHEFAHAWVADRLGDPTPRQSGRVSLNPLHHIDPLGLVALIFFRVGWGKPIAINYDYLKNIKQGLLLTSLAGLAANLGLALIALLLLQPLKYAPNYLFLLERFMHYLVVYNMILFLFNLLPLPPLDGYKIVLIAMRNKPLNFLEDYRINLGGIAIIAILLYIGFIHRYILCGLEIVGLALFMIVDLDRRSSIDIFTGN